MSALAQFEEWRRVRLQNWGRWRWSDLMAGAPDSSCANPLYEMFIWHDDTDGYGDASEAVLVLQAAPARAEREPVDVADAETVHGWVAQLPKGHRAVLSRRYVLHEQVDGDRVDAAIYAILDLMGANRRVVERMRHGPSQ